MDRTEQAQLRRARPVLWVVQTHDGVLVGDCGLTIQDVEGEPFVEVGYHVHLVLRGQGLATEAAYRGSFRSA